jgi:O-antigen ligase
VTATVFLVCFFAACVLALVRHPIFGMLAYVAVFYVNPPVRWWGQGFLLNFRWSVIAAAVTFLGILIHKTGRQDTSFARQPISLVYFAFIAWLAIQLSWAIDPDKQWEILEYYLKFGLAAFLILRCLDTEARFRYFLWAHVLGCFYFGWLAFTSHDGGRFEEFGGAGVKDANEAALTIGTGALVLGSLILWEKFSRKALLVGMAPFLVNAIIATVSRSGFLSLALGGLAFNILSPPRYRKWVVPLSVLAGILMLALTTEDYWNRIETIAYRGQEVEGKDTGSGRLEIIAAQFRMFEAHPLGCGHACTAILSPQYLGPEHLQTEAGVRASHNTFMSMLVEHGLPGAAIYLLAAWFIFRQALKVFAESRRSAGFVSVMLPAVGGSLAAMFIADQFVPYMRFEVRIWFVCLLFTLWRFQQTAVTEAETHSRGHP